MHYFWFIPLFVALVVAITVFYIIVSRGTAKTSDRCVEGALADERDEIEHAKAAAGSH